MPTESITNIQQCYTEGEREATLEHKAGAQMKEHWYKNNANCVVNFLFNGVPLNQPGVL